MINIYNNWVNISGYSWTKKKEITFEYMRVGLCNAVTDCN